MIRITKSGFLRFAGIIKLAGPERLQVLKTKYPDQAEDIDALAAKDPTGDQYKYLDWMVRIRRKQESDIGRYALIDAVIQFHDYRKYLGSEKYGTKEYSTDINAYKSARELRNKMAEAKPLVIGATRVDQVRKKNPKLKKEIRALAAADPTGEQRHLDWAVTQLAFAGESGDAVEDVARIITMHHDMTKRVREVGQQMPALSGMSLDQARRTLDEAERMLDKSADNSEIVFDDAEWRVYDVKDKITSCKLGKGRWCVSSWSNNYWDQYTSGDDWRFLMFKSKDTNDDFLVYLRNDNVEEVKDWNNEESGLGGFPSYILDKLGIDADIETQQSEDIYVMYVPDRASNDPHTWGGIWDLRNYASGDTYALRYGAEIYSATVYGGDAEAVRDGDFYLESAELHDEELVETIDAETETVYAVTEYHHDPNDGVLGWFRHKNDAEKYAKGRQAEGYALFTVELGYGVMDEESERYWGDYIADFDQEEDFPGVGAKALRFVDLGGHGIRTDIIDTDEGNWKPLGTYASTEEAEFAVRKLVDAGYELYYVDETGGTEETEPYKGTEESRSTVQPALPGFEDQTPRQTEMGPSAGDYVVGTQGQVSVFGQEGPIAAGGLDAAKQHRIDQGRPNAPIWVQEGEEKYRVVACNLTELQAEEVVAVLQHRGLGDDAAPEVFEELFLVPPTEADRRAIEQRTAELIHRRHTDTLPPDRILLFSDNPDRNRHYGPYSWRLLSDLPEIPEWVYEFAADYYNVSVDQIRDEVNPPDIVGTAGVWDDEQFVSDIYWTSGKHPIGFRTQNGAVVLDQKSVILERPQSDKEAGMKELMSGGLALALGTGAAAPQVMQHMTQNQPPAQVQQAPAAKAAPAGAIDARTPEGYVRMVPGYLYDAELDKLVPVPDEATRPGKPVVVKGALPAALLAAARWLLTSPQAWMLVATAYPQLKDLWTKFESGHASLEDAIAVVQKVGPDAVATFKSGMRVSYEDELQHTGELEVDALRAGDSVRFDAEFNRPGWPRVDAGTIGTIRGVDYNAQIAEVEVQYAEHHASDGSTRVSSARLPVGVSDITLLLHTRDPRSTERDVAQLSESLDPSTVVDAIQEL